MALHTALATPDRLEDRRLLVYLREAIDAARARPRLAAEVRHLLADNLAEMKAEALSVTDLDPETIVRLAHVPADPEPSAATATKARPRDVIRFPTAGSVAAPGCASGHAPAAQWASEGAKP